MGLTRWRETWYRVRGTLGGGRQLDEMDEEFRFHLDQATERNLARGMTPAEARRHALRQFGGVARHRDAGADERRSPWLEGIAQDLRLAGRTLRRSPVFTAATLLLVSLGIAANTAIFSVVNGVLLRPLPFPEPERVLYLGWDYGNGRSIGALSFFQLGFVRREAASLQGAATWRSVERVLGDPDDVPLARGIQVSQDFFRVIEQQPAAGRPFLPGEHLPGAAEVVIVSDGFWRGQLGADSGALGRDLRLAGRNHRIVGVMPPSFRLPDLAGPVELLLPLRVQPDPNDAGQNYTVLARMAPGVSREAVAVDLRDVSRRFVATHPDHGGPGGNGATAAPPRFMPLGFDDVFVGDLQRLLWVLFAAVGVVTLIVCINAASLLAARATDRRREMAVRAALGAGRGRSVRQLLIESLVLSVVAGALGLLLGHWGLQGLLALVPRELPRSDEIGLDWRVATFTGGVALLTGLGFGLLSGFAATRGGLIATASRGGRGATAGGGRLRESLIVAEIGLAVVLVTAAGLLLASFARLRSVDPGFDPAGVVTARVTRMPSEYGREARFWDFERRALDALRALPGVKAAATLSSFPLERGINMPMTIEGRPDASEGAVEWRQVSPDYFAALGVPLVRGRAFLDADDAAAPRVAVVNAAFAQRYWPGESPIGKRVELGRWQGRWLSPGFEGAVTVVGVAGDMREITLAREARRTLYVPRAQWGDGLNRPLFAVRTAGHVDLDSRIAQVIGEIEPRMPPVATSTLPAIVERSVAEQRFQAVLLTIFGVSALLLTAVGIYGVTAYHVTQRRREIGVRMALGAPRFTVVGLVLRRGMLLLGCGIALGLLGAVGATRLLRGMLYEVSPTDPGTLGWSILVLAVAALAATLLPARRATRVHPTEALRME